MVRWLLVLPFALGCAVDASGIPERTEGPDGGGGDLGRPDLGAMDLGPDQGPRDGGRDLGPPPDMPSCVESPEICNGADDDCDGAVDEDLFSEACDGDGDGCMDGRTACIDGRTECDDGPDRVATACDGPDADDVAEGIWTCEGNALTCPTDCFPAAEVCNRRDDDCDGAVDEDGVCSDSSDSCRSVRRGDSIYLICTEPGGGDGWFAAGGECARGGYTLARLDDEAERVFLYAEAGVGQWWVGARTDRLDGPGRRDTSTWTWRPSGAAVATELWAGSEPSGDGSCGHLAQALGGELNDLPCDRELGYLCEGTIVP